MWIEYLPSVKPELWGYPLSTFLVQPVVVHADLIIDILSVRTLVDKDQFQV